MKRYCQHKKLGMAHRIIIGPYNGYAVDMEKIVKTCRACGLDLPPDYEYIGWFKMALWGLALAVVGMSGVGLFVFIQRWMERLQ